MNEVFWVRLFCAEFDDPRWLAIEQMPDADAVQIIYVRMLMLAGRSNAGGLLLLHESLPYDVTTLSAVLRRTVPVVQFALATLERFKFIEVVDSVIAITAWDQLQATDELARLAERREKDKVRKRLERAEKRSQLLLASADASTDSPQKSGTTKIDSNSVTTTPATALKGEDVVVGELEEVLALVPPAERNKRLQTVIADAVLRHGKAVTVSNIRYALANHDPHKGRLGGMICSAIELDFARAEREATRVEAKAQAAASARRENAEAVRREQEERERREALAHQATWLSLPAHERVGLARQARKKFPCLPEPAAPLETVLDDPAVPITKILAAMYARGKLFLPVEGG
jgi:predicted phage replisome organizer